MISSQIDENSDHTVHSKISSFGRNAFYICSLDQEVSSFQMSPFCHPSRDIYQSKFALTLPILTGHNTEWLHCNANMSNYNSEKDQEIEAELPVKVGSLKNPAGYNDHNLRLPFPVKKLSSTESRTDSEYLLKLPEWLNETSQSDSCNTEFNKSLYPEVASAKIGATNFMSAYGIRPLVCPFGYVEHKSEQELLLSFVISLNCLFSTNFSWKSDTTENCNEYLFQIINRHQIILKLRFPYQGFYTLEVFAERKAINEQPRNVFNYIIHVKEIGKNIARFPQVHKDWYVAGFLLKKPMDCLLPSHTHSKFVVRVLRALSVFLTNGEVSVELKEHDGSWWIGLINTGFAGTEIILHAVFSADPYVPVPLLSYLVVQTIGKKRLSKISKFEEEIVSAEELRLKLLYADNQEGFHTLLREEETSINEKVLSNRLRLTKLSHGKTTVNWNLKRNSLKLSGQTKFKLLERKVLQKLQHEFIQQLVNIQKTEEEKILAIHADGKTAIWKIRKSLKDLLTGLNIPQDKVAERLKKQEELLLQWQTKMTKLFAHNNWIYEGIKEVAALQSKALMTIAEMQTVTLTSLSSVTGKQPVDRQQKFQKPVDQMESLKMEQMKVITDDAKAFADEYGQMKQNNLKQIYKLQIKELKELNAWLKSQEIKLFELKEVGSPASHIASTLRKDVDTAETSAKERLNAFRSVATQNTHEMQKEYKTRFLKFQEKKEEQLKEFLVKLDANVLTIYRNDRRLFHQLQQKVTEIDKHLQSHLTETIKEIDRELREILTVHATVHSVLKEVEETQKETFQNVLNMIQVDGSDKETLVIDIFNDLNKKHKENVMNAKRALDGYFDVEGRKVGEPSIFNFESDSKTTISAFTTDEDALENEELLTCNPSSSEGDFKVGIVKSENETQMINDAEDMCANEDLPVSNANQYRHLMIGKNNSFKDAALKLMEESTEGLIQVKNSINLKDFQKQSEMLKDNQRQAMKAVLTVEDLLSQETQEVVMYIVKEVTSSFQARMSSLKDMEEESLMKVRRIKRDSVFEVKEWLEKRFSMMAEHDMKALAKLRNEINTMISEMEKHGIERATSVKKAITDNGAKLAWHYKVLSKAVSLRELDVKRKLLPMLGINYFENLSKETEMQLESSFNDCYGKLRKKLAAWMLEVEIEEKEKTNQFKAQVIKNFWLNIQAGEEEAIDELQKYCSNIQNNSFETAQNLVRKEEQAIDLIKTDLIKKYADITKAEMRKRKILQEDEAQRLSKIKSLLSESPRMLPEIKQEEDERLLDKRLKEEERLFELERKQEEALASLQALRKMRYSELEVRFQGSLKKMTIDFETMATDYINDEHLTGKAKNIQDEALMNISDSHKKAMDIINTYDQKIFSEMEQQILITFEKINNETQKCFRFVTEIQDPIFQPVTAEDDEEYKAEMTKVNMKYHTADAVNKISGKLVAVLKSREISELRDWLDEVRNKCLESVLYEQVASATELLKTLEYKEELCHEIMLLDIRKMLRQFQMWCSPNPSAHKVLVALLLVLGDDEGFTNDWKNCLRRLLPIGTTKLKCRIKKLVLKDLNVRVARRALDILCGVSIERIQEISLELLTIRNWTQAVCEDCVAVKLRTSHITSGPATLKQQVQIFSEKYKCREPLAGPRIFFCDEEQQSASQTDTMLEAHRPFTFSYTELYTTQLTMQYLDV